MNIEWICYIIPTCILNTAKSLSGHSKQAFPQRVITHLLQVYTAWGILLKTFEQVVATFWWHIKLEGCLTCS